MSQKPSIFDIWNHIYGSSPQRCGVYCSPFRGDRNPSLSIFANGTRWHDHATGQGGDGFDFAAAAWDLNIKKDFMEIKRRLGLEQQPVRMVRESQSSGHAIGDPKQIKAIIREARKWMGTEALALCNKKQVSKEAIATLRDADHFGCLGPWPVFIYEDGIKIRYEAETSRSCRWMLGSANGKPWRSDLIHGAETIIIFEGETDLMYAMSVMPEPDGVAYVAAPSATWKPGQIWFDENLKGKRIITIFDNDEAGNKATDYWKQIAKIKAFAWPNATHGWDFSRLPKEQAAETIKNLLTI